MVQPFEKALEQIAQNTTVMAKQMPIIADSVTKIYKVETEEKKKVEEKEIEKKRAEADPSGGKGENKEILKELGGLNAKMGNVDKSLKKSQKESQGIVSTVLNLAKSVFGLQRGGVVQTPRTQGFAKGGGVYTVPGTSTGDKHPMFLPSGSFVLNRNASKFIQSRQSGGYITSLPFGFDSGGMVPTMVESKEKIFAPGQWDGLVPILNDMIPRFQSGGLVEHLHGDPGRKGYDYSHGTESNAHDHFAFATPELMAKIRDGLAAGQGPSGRKWQIGSQNDGVHATGSYHYTNQAFDVPWSQFGSGAIGENDYKQSRQLLADVKALLGDTSSSSSSTSEKSSGAAPGQSTSGGLAGVAGDILGGLFNMAMPSFDLGSLFGFGSISDILLGGANTSGSGGATSTGGGSGSSTPLSGDVLSKANMMFDYIVGKGYTPAQAKGIVANIHRESTFDPSIRSGDDGGPGGLFQWKGSRQTPQVAALVNSGDWKGQIDYALQEDVGPQYKNATANMSAHEASMWWAKHWERPASLSNADRKHQQFLSGYKFQSGGMVPSMVESGETIFPPGSFGPEVSMLNELFPRFGSGSSANISRSMNPIHNLFQQANKVKMDSDRSSNQPIIIPVPQPIPAGGGMVNDNTSGSYTPQLPNEPSNHIVSTLIMQTYALMNKIG